MTISKEADQAIRSVNFSLGQLAILRFAIADASIQELWRTLLSESTVSLNAISNIVSHVEIFTIVSIGDLSSRCFAVLPGSGPDEFAKEKLREVEESWEKRMDILRTWTGTSIKSWTGWQAWLGWIAARNAWAHGQGVLTRRQKSQRGIAESLSAAGLERHGDRVVADSVGARRCADAGIDLIGRVDELCRQ